MSSRGRRPPLAYTPGTSIGRCDPSNAVALAARSSCGTTDANGTLLVQRIPNALPPGECGLIDFVAFDTDGAMVSCPEETVLK